MAYTVIWYGKQGIVEKTPFDAEKAARDHALATFPDRKSGIVAGSSQRRWHGCIQQSRRQLKSQRFGLISAILTMRKRICLSAGAPTVRPGTLLAGALDRPIQRGQSRATG